MPRYAHVWNIHNYDELLFSSKGGCEGLAEGGTQGLGRNGWEMLRKDITLAQ